MIEQTIEFTGYAQMAEGLEKAHELLAVSRYLKSHDKLSGHFLNGADVTTYWLLSKSKAEELWTVSRVDERRPFRVSEEDVHKGSIITFFPLESYPGLDPALVQMRGIDARLAQDKNTLPYPVLNTKTIEQAYGGKTAARPSGPFWASVGRGLTSWLKPKAPAARP